MSQYLVTAIGKDKHATCIDDTVVNGKEEVNKTIKTFRERHGDKLERITVWNETSQKPAKGWNDGYR